MQLPWGQLHSTSCLKASQMAFLQNYLQEAFMPNWPIKGESQGNCLDFLFPFWTTFAHSCTASSYYRASTSWIFFSKVTSCVLFPSPVPPFLSSFLFLPLSFLPSISLSFHLSFHPSFHPSFFPSFQPSHPNFQNAIMCQTHNVKYSVKQKS